MFNCQWGRDRRGHEPTEQRRITILETLLGVTFGLDLPINNKESVMQSQQ